MDKLEAMEMAAEREMGALDESHRQQTKILEDKVEEWRNESMNLRQQLAAADNEVEARVGEKCLTINALQEQLAATNEVICGMRSAISYLKARLSAICYYFASPLPLGQAGFPTGIEIKDAIKRGEKALSSSPTCPHKEEAELNKKLYAETQEVYAFSVKTENELRDQLAVSKDEVERLLDKCASLRLCDDKDLNELAQAQEKINMLQEPRDLYFRELAQMREALEKIRKLSSSSNEYCQCPAIYDITTVTKTLTKE